MVAIKKDRLLSCDPSINNLGMAIWDLESKKLMVHRLLHPAKDCRENEYDKSLSMFNQVKGWVGSGSSYGVRRMILEIPEYWAISGFQARETGSISKLMFVCGMLYSLRNNLDELKLVSPREWKGQLPKDVVENRLRDEYLPDIDLSKINDNVVDAIGIGHFYLHGKV